jgi:hypothetical protein
MAELLKRSFDLWVEKRWLREIERTCDRHKRLVFKANREYHALSALVKRYNEIYNQNLGVKYGK